MKLTDKISWLMGRVQRSLFPHLNQCLQTPLTAQEERLVSILEIVQVERHVPRSVRRHRHPGRKPLDRQACARAFVAKALYRHPTTSDLRRALQAIENLVITSYSIHYTKLYDIDRLHSIEQNIIFTLSRGTMFTGADLVNWYASVEICLSEKTSAIWFTI